MDQTFCEKIPLDLQLADLLIQLRQPRIVRRGNIGQLGPASHKQRTNSTEHGLISCMDLAGVHRISARYFRYCAVLPHRR
jgi:hypothetical protein